MRTFKNHFVGLDIGYSDDSVYVESWVSETGKHCLNTIVIGKWKDIDYIDKFLNTREPLTLTKDTPIFIDEAFPQSIEELRRKGWNIVSSNHYILSEQMPRPQSMSKKPTEQYCKEIFAYIKKNLDEGKVLKDIKWGEEDGKAIFSWLPTKVDSNSPVLLNGSIHVERPKQSMSKKVKSELAGLKDRVAKLEELNRQRDEDEENERENERLFG